MYALALANSSLLLFSYKFNPSIFVSYTYFRPWISFWWSTAIFTFKFYISCNWMFLCLLISSFISLFYLSYIYINLLIYIPWVYNNAKFLSFSLSFNPITFIKLSISEINTCFCNSSCSFPLSYSNPSIFSM